MADLPEEVRNKHAYILVRFKADFIQTMRNSLLTQASYTTNCRGRVLGIGRDVEIYDGQWSQGTYLLVMFFETMREAVMWMQSAPEAKQPDWIHPGIEVAVVPLQAAPSNKPWITLISSHFRGGKLSEAEQWMRDKGGEAVQKIREAGGEGFVAFTDRKVQPKGRLYLGHVCIHQWGTKQQFLDWFNKDETAKHRDDTRQLTMQRDIVLFGLEPLQQETEYSMAVKDANKGFLW